MGIISGGILLGSPWLIYTAGNKGYFLAVNSYINRYFEANIILYLSAALGVWVALRNKWRDLFYLAMFAGMLPIQSVLRAGRVRALAVTSLQRVSSLPDIPTIAETGVPGYDVATWYGVLAPAGTLRPIVNRLNREIVTILKTPEVRQKLQDDGAEVVAGTPEAFEKMMRAELEKWARVVKATGARLD